MPKDLRALSYTAKMRDLDLPIITSILPSNEMQISRGLQLILERGHTRVGILGFSFKAGTDELRESALIEVIERLIGRGYDLRIYDKNVNIASLVGRIGISFSIASLTYRSLWSTTLRRY